MAAGRGLLQQLADEKWVAPRHLEACAHELVVRFAGQPGGDERADRCERQRRWAQDLRGGVADDGCRLGRQGRIERPRCEDRSQRLPFDPPCHERERARRRGITPLQIVEYEY